ncbi:LysR family transcriptional regulator (plasmid) [Paroceanicella profunda]|uniref:LysR family transcriptional regulator n=2 Tax=Paroceanicella profunda TaxID=2579971 RepID=A0A5B8G019_9RHOB|nr:LysR family transcriptional regulator [Paroceanicella profunda]
MHMPEGLNHYENSAPRAREDRLVRRGMRLPHLRLMAALESTGQISAAATALAMSQPAASRLCAEMEEMTGVTLYRRTGRGVELTVYGQRLARRARTILRELDEADREITELRSGLSGRVRIGAVTGAAIELLLPAIRQARVNYPGIDISVEVGTSDELCGILDSGRIDFFLGRIPATRELRRYGAEFLAEEPVSLVVRPGHPLLRQNPVRLEDCVRYDWVMQPEGTLLRRTVEDRLQQLAVALPAKVLSTSSLLLTLITISQTNAITPVARSVADFFGASAEFGARLEALPLAQVITISPYSIVSLPGQSLSPASQIIHDLVRRRFIDRGAQPAPLPP